MKVHLKEPKGKFPCPGFRDDRLEQRIMQVNVNQGYYDYYVEAEYDGTELMNKMP